MAKGIDDTNLRMLMEHDRIHDDCMVREFEMLTDILLITPMYQLQFWQDVRLYGVREAILYVKNGNHGDWEAIQREWDRIKVRIEDPSLVDSEA